MDAVASRPSPQDDNAVALQRLCRMRVLWEKAYRTAENEGIPQIAAVVDDRTVDGWQAQFIAIVADSGDDALPHARRVQDARRQIIAGQILRAEAEKVGAGDGPGRYAHDIAHDAANAGVGPAERLQR